VSKAATNNIVISKQVSLSFTTLAAFNATWVDGDILRFEIQGNTLRAYQNGNKIETDVFDTSLGSGTPGIIYSSTSTAAAIDDFQGGDLGPTWFPMLRKHNALSGA
jgi:hypothetical protein